jgi:anaerobic ribonucleoside-triphosphate reductase activating protein
MLRFLSYDIVFQEVPGEVTLAINISNCPNRCVGCHSPHLMEDKGEVLDENSLSALMGKYGNSITCVCFMGGDASPCDVQKLALLIKHKVKTAWYSGKENFPSDCSLHSFDYIKLGAYVKHLGGLDSPTSNQRFYSVQNGKMLDITACFVNKRIDML